MKLGKVLWGLLVVGAAILLLLMAFNVGIGKEYSAVLIIGSLLLAGIAITSLVKRNFFLFFIPLSVMAYLWKDTPFWTDTLGLPEPKIWLLLGAAALLSIGFSIIFHKKGSYHFEAKTDGDWKTEEVLNDNENVNIEANWGEHIKYVHASNLKKARIKSSFASTRVFFDQCQVSSEGLEINVNASFCEVVINVPRDWKIDNRVSVFAGAVTDHSGGRSEGTVKVVLSGSMNFGELKVNYI